jgi:hypothetical protein
MLKTVEALVSLLVVLSFLSFGLVHHPVQHSQLYRYELAEDAWRVVYLRGGLLPCENAKGLLGPDEHAMNRDVDRIQEIAGLCFEMDKLQVASCLPGEEAVVLHKTVYGPLGPFPVEVRVGPDSSSE